MSMLASGMDLVSISGGSGYRPEAGRILPYGGTTAPEGYLLCDGEAYSRTEYSELFEVIGTTFGSGDGSTTFNVPDLRGRTSIGANASHLLGATGGAETHTHGLETGYAKQTYWGDKTATVKEVSGLPQWTSTYSITVSAAGAKSKDSTYGTQLGGSTETSSSMPPYQVVNYIICTGKLGYAGIKGDKGEKGDTGSTGAAAGFGTPTATVDSHTGTPSVTVTATGPDTAKVFEFEFENIKGEKGEPLGVDNFVPVAAGLIYPYAGSTAPTGYLMCDGAAVSRITYADLFEAIGTTYGAGDGETTFNVPDLRGRVPLGSSTDYALGSTGGEASHTLQESEMPSHSHTMDHGHGFTQPTVNGGATTTSSKSLTGWTALYKDMGMFDPGSSYRSGVITIGGQRSSTYRPGWTSGVSRDMNISASHDHPQVAHTHSVSGGAVSNHSGSTGNKGDGGAHNNLQPYTATNYIISTGFEYGGLQGEAAGFGTPTASVDSGYGTPSVTVTASGPDTAKVFDFEFENLKGEPGIQGPKGDKGDKGDPFTIEDTVEISAGIIHPFAGSTAPDGYLMCDGAAVSRETYAELFQAIGTIYGAGDGSTTFNVPDLRGRTLIGASTNHALGTTGGAEEVALETAQIPSHNHPLQVEYGNAGSTSYSPATGTYLFVAGRNAGTKNTADNPGVIHNTGGGQAHNNMQPYATTNYIICTGKKFPALKGDTGDMATGFYVGTTEPQGDSYFFWYNPLNGAVKVKQYVEPDSLTDGGWAWREMVFADEGKNGDVYMATADELEEAVPAN